MNHIEILNNPATNTTIEHKLADITIGEFEMYGTDDDLLDWESGYQWKDNEYISPMYYA